MKRNRIGDDRIVRISPLPRAPVFAGALGQVKRNRIGYDRIVRRSPLPRAPLFAGVLGQVKRAPDFLGPVKNSIIGSYVGRPASSVRLLAAAGA